MLKAFARAAAFLAYLVITLEMLFMVTPFALYYYSFYSPLLAGPSSLRAIGLAASLLLTSPLHRNSPKFRGRDLSVGLGRLLPECLSTLLC